MGGRLRSLSLLVQLLVWEPVCWAISHLSSPPGLGAPESREAASTAHHSGPSSRGGKQEAEMAHWLSVHAQPSIY